VNELDYTRYGRQIALTEIGATGQRKLAIESVRFVPAFGADAVAERAAQLHRRAGGTVDDRSDVVVRVPNARGVPARLGVAAVAAVEAARRALGQPARELPDALVAQLDVDGEGP
jgi:hypothetical protein